MAHLIVRGTFGTAVAAVAAVAVLPLLTASAASASSSASASAFAGGTGGTGDRLTVTVAHAGDGRDGTYELSCHPGAGSHPDVSGACRALDRNTRWGRDAFAPVAPGTACTMLHGGPATARVTGTWAGRPVDATYDRSNGCETGRWDRMVPLLPDLGP
ncbi:SSI family serine proteinase inhibitor [Streptomyces humi]|uniref:SSI family serine proteinase inhibitor n=1 Tax=Streptomyces humi TaxID=1428620 RepID=UPI00062876E2|nr:SSI family serine proteinase inhibitor [Streptomyces humi]